MLKQPFYNRYESTDYNLEGVDFVHKCGVYCGNYPELDQNDLDLITKCLRKSYDNS